MRDNKVLSLTTMAVFMALTIVATFMIRIPVPATQGYVHLGDAVLLAGVFFMGTVKGSVAGAIAQGITDLLSGYAVFAPITFVAKLLGGLLMGTAFVCFFKYREEKKASYLVKGILLAILGVVAVVGVYYGAETAMFGWAAALVEVPLNVIQFLGGGILAGLLVAALKKTSASKLMSN